MKEDPDWTRSFFSGLIVESQRRIPQQTAVEAEFLRSALDLKPGDRVLDVPCGTGRLSIALADFGCEVAGIDISEELLSDARRGAGERKPPPKFEQRDMRDLPWPNTFDAAFCFGNSFSYLGEDGNAAFLRAVFAALKSGGRFALETRFVSESVLMNLTPKRWYPFGDLYFLHDTGYDPATATVTSNYTLIRGSTVEQKTAVYNVYTFRELLRLLTQVGFADPQTFGSLSREPFRLGSPGLWLVVRKPSS